MGKESDSLNSFELLLQERWRQIHQILFRLTGDSAEAEDLTLEAFWRFYKHKKALSNYNPTGWIYRVAVNLGLNSLRARKRRQWYEHEAGMHAAEIATANENTINERSMEQRRMIRLALAQMNKHYARVLIMRHSGLSYSEIANLLEVSTNSIGTMLARAEKDFEKHYRKLKGD